MIRRTNVCLAAALIALSIFSSSTAALAQAPTETVDQPVAEPKIYAPGVPPVYLTAGHSKLCKVRVGDRLPGMELPRLDGSPASPLSLAGKQATVALFWSAEGWMSRAALRDLSRDIAAQFQPGAVSLVGVAVDSPVEAVRAAVQDAGAKFPQFLDAEGALLTQVGSGRLPRVYVLDADAGPVVAWFDIEYSEATRRELRDALLALTDSKTDKSKRK